MTNRTIRVEEVKQTESYKNLTKMLQSMVRTRNNIVAINNGYNVAKNIGFESWEKISNSRYYNKQIIKELITTNNF